MHHSYAFTFKDVPIAIHARSFSKEIVQDNCVRCHISMARHPIAGPSINEEALNCIECHRSVGHEH